MSVSVMSAPAHMVAAIEHALRDWMQSCIAAMSIGMLPMGMDFIISIVSTSSPVAGPGRGRGIRLCDEMLRQQPFGVEPGNEATDAAMLAGLVEDQRRRGRRQRDRHQRRITRRASQLPKNWPSCTITMITATVM
ncbi:hypothetical protein GCM10022288_00520 [Gryllotalpicola kribbensis]|uniref:Uncharacterized protein n=1 Tax=Gryllotalpicola kribbensis TaxID=993084 RepID=A0ABP8AEA8_9MICO